MGNWDIANRTMFMDKTAAQNYADNTLKWTMECGLPQSEMLGWYRTRDIATRSKMMELMCQPPHLSAAVFPSLCGFICKLLSFTQAESWANMLKMLLPPLCIFV